MIPSDCEGRVLIIEDETRVAAVLCQCLVDAGYLVTVASTGEQGLIELDHQQFDLCVLDMMLPGVGGLAVLNILRQNTATTKVIVLSARDSAEDRVLGLESGADDYVVKPFSIAEVLARIRILLRRHSFLKQETLRLADLQMDCTSREVIRGKLRIDLTPLEYAILEFLLRHQRSVVTRNMLIQNIWQGAQRMTPIDNVIDVHIARLRRKLNGAGEIQLLHTIRGVGFLLSERGGPSSSE